MKKVLSSISGTRYAFAGLVMSLGAPLGFYLHSFFFNNQLGYHLIQHIEWLHKNQFSTVLYIGLGTSIFFTLGGYLIGNKAEEVTRQECLLEEERKIKEQIEKNKKDLLYYFINQFQLPLANVIEVLTYIKDKFHTIKMDEVEMLLKEVTLELEKLRKEKPILFYTNEKNEVSSVIKATSELELLFKKNLLEVTPRFFNYPHQHYFNTSPEQFLALMERLISIFTIYESYPKEVRTTHFSTHSFKEFTSLQNIELNSYLKEDQEYVVWEFIFQTEEELKSIRHVYFEEMVKQMNGHFFSYNTSIHVFFPLSTNSSYRQEAA